MRFTATVQLDGRTATGITVPPDVLAELGGKRPAVVVTIGDHSFRTTIGSMGGVAKIPLSAANRTAAGVSAGDEVDVEVVPDGAPREVEPPADLAAALAAEPGAAAFFQTLSATNRKLYVTWIESAKKAETRDRRVAESVAKLRDGETLR